MHRGGIHLVAAPAENVKAGEPALVAARDLAVDQAGPHLEVVHRLHHKRVAGCPVVAITGNQPDADRVPPGHEAEAVVLYLVNPVGPGRRAIGGGWEAGLDKAGGHCPVYLGGRGGESRSPHRVPLGCASIGGASCFEPGSRRERHTGRRLTDHPPGDTRGPRRGFAALLGTLSINSGVR
jgi:hypothetical protein